MDTSSASRLANRLLNLKYFWSYTGTFYGLAADRQEYCFTKDFFFINIFLNLFHLYSSEVI